VAWYATTRPFRYDAVSKARAGLDPTLTGGLVPNTLASGPAVRCSQCVAVLVHRPTLAGHDRLVRVWVRSLDCGKAVE
jgi:hypothetical protein